jgi:hypothetical protein
MKNLLLTLDSHTWLSTSVGIQQASLLLISWPWCVWKWDSDSACALWGSRNKYFSSLKNSGG